MIKFQPSPPSAKISHKLGTFVVVATEFRSCLLLQHGAKLTDTVNRREDDPVRGQRRVVCCDVVIGEAKALSSWIFGEGHLKMY